MQEQPKKEKFTAEEISRQSNRNDDDEVKRQILRGDETKGDPNERDVAGAPDSDETPQGREETKN